MFAFISNSNPAASQSTRTKGFPIRLLPNTNRKMIAAVCAVIFLLGAGACSGYKEDELVQDAQLKIALNALSGFRVYFGHHSVGGEILLGVSELASVNEVSVSIVAANEQEEYDQGTIVHGNVGMNEDPISKIKHFDAIMRGGMATVVDAAFFKFCFVDVDRETNVDELFREYRAVVGALERDYPDVIFLHVTMPIVSRPLPLITRAKNFAKAILGRYIVSSRLNLIRETYNDKLREAYSESGRLFDLARIQAIGTDESVNTTRTEDRSRAMQRAFTYDGGHLNRYGRQHIATELIRFLGSLAG